MSLIRPLPDQVLLDLYRTGTVLASMADDFDAIADAD